MVRASPGQVSLGKVASLVGMIQAVVWFTMCLVCVIEYSIDTQPEPTNSYMDNLNLRLHYFLLDKNAVYPSPRIITPTGFLVFMCIYIVLNTTWFVVSLFQINVLKKDSVNVPIFFKDWALVTLIISFVDVILVVLIGCDYNLSCLPHYEEDICINTLIPVLVIAARGFALWFVNVILALKLLRSAKMLQNVRSHKGALRGFIPTYYTTPFHHIPRVAVPSSPSLYSDQYGFIKNNTFWNVNLRTAMDNRTPPISSTSPYASGEFFQKY